MEESKHPEEESLENKAWCWSAVNASGKPPCQRSLHSAVSHDSWVYIFGGYDGVQRTNDFYKFDFATLKWTQVTTDDIPPSPRDRHVAVVHDRSIFIYGGYDGFNRVNDFYEYNVDTNSWSEVLWSGTGVPPSARHSHAAVVYDGSMYVFAGYDGLYRNDFHRFNFETNTWRVVTDSLGANDHWPKPRYRTSATVAADKMFVFGGHDGARQLNDFYAWSFTNETWNQIDCIGSPPSARDSHEAVAYKNSLFIFGGSTGNAKSDFYEYRLDENRWMPVYSTGGKPPCSRFCHVAVVVKKCLYIFGGYDGLQRLNDFLQFRIESESPEIPPSTITDDLNSYVNNPMFSDITFVVEDQKVYGHRLLLTRSNYFEAMFGNSMLESTSKEIPIANFSHSTFLAIMKYLYTDTIDINLETAMELFEAAGFFCIERLKNMCEQTILASIDVENVSNILQASDVHNACNLRDAALRFLINNFDSVSRTESFQEMARANVELVLEILSKR